MSCSNRNNAASRSIELVRELAQKSANLLQCVQKIYKVQCDGVTIFKFSDTWKGEVYETVNPVQFSGDNTSENIFSNTKDRELGVTKSTKNKSGKTGTNKDME